MNNADKLVRKFYSHHIKKYGKDDIRAMGWHDEEEYSIRFEICCSKVDLVESSILDVGCGFGGLYKYLVGEGIKCDYLGIDIMPEMIDNAKEKNPTGRFEVGDFLDEKRRFDHVFCIGTLNAAVDGEYFRKMLDKLIELANKTVVINFLADRNYLANGPYHFENGKKLKEDLEEKYEVSVEVIIDKRIIGENVLVIRKN